MKKERTTKQKQASNRAYALMTLSGITTRLKDLMKRTDDEANQKALSTCISYCKYAEIVVEESRVEDWNDNLQ